jgi:hypothetical protein
VTTAGDKLRARQAWSGGADRRKQLEHDLGLTFMSFDESASKLHGIDGRFRDVLETSGKPHSKVLQFESGEELDAAFRRAVSLLPHSEEPVLVRFSDADSLGIAKISFGDLAKNALAAVRTDGDGLVFASEDLREIALIDLLAARDEPETFELRVAGDRWSEVFD